MSRERRPAQGFSRRGLLGGTLAVGGAVALGGTASAAPAFIRSGRPGLTHGVQSGDVSAHAATVWTRADRPARMVVEASTRPDFRGARRISGAALTPDSDGTGKTVLSRLPAGRDIYYRVTPVGLHDHRASGEPVTGHFRTVPDRRRDVSFLWSGDLGGQGFGINPDIGGYRIFAEMAKLDPDFYLCNGDNIYADDPIDPTMTLPDGSVWRNRTTIEKSKVAETLDEYRGNYKYNLLDHNLRAFYADVAQVQQWDDHETHNNWYPGELLDDPLYKEKRVDVLKYRARQAWHRVHADRAALRPRRPHLSGAAPRRTARRVRTRHAVVPRRQFRRQAELQRRRHSRLPAGGLAETRAGRLAGDLEGHLQRHAARRGRSPTAANIEAVEQGDNGAPLGRELQIADILTFLKRHDIRNVVWLTTDVHYTAAHYFDPDKAAYTDFNPFWQFTSGPLNAGSFPPDAVDTTFGAQQVFVKAPPTPNASPGTEYQFFGQVSIDAASRALTVRLRDNAGDVLWSTELQPHRR